MDNGYHLIIVYLRVLFIDFFFTPLTANVPQVISLLSYIKNTILYRIFILSENGILKSILDNFKNCVSIFTY